MDGMQTVVDQLREVRSDDREVAVVAVAEESGLPTLLLLVAGQVDRIALTPSQVLRPVISGGHTGFTLLHTHREDRPPSQADLRFTRRLVAASAVVGVSLRGHLVVAPSRVWDCVAEASHRTLLSGEVPQPVVRGASARACTRSVRAV